VQLQIVARLSNFFVFIGVSEWSREVAGVFRLHPVPVNRIALRAGQRRGCGRRRASLPRNGAAMTRGTLDKNGREPSFEAVADFG
jgi:hypothetical protein